MPGLQGITDTVLHGILPHKCDCLGRGFTKTDYFTKMLRKVTKFVSFVKTLSLKTS